jgi:hypothetical protein
MQKAIDTARNRNRFAYEIYEEEVAWWQKRNF